MFRDEALRQQVVGDSALARPVSASIAPLRNIDAWYEAFDVKAGDTLYVPPTERVRIW